MKRHRLKLTLGLSLALVAGSGALVWASTNESLPRNCADITNGSVSYSAPIEYKDAVTKTTTGFKSGSVTAVITLREATCLDVEYGAVALAAEPDSEDPNASPTVVGSASVPGDGSYSRLSLTFPVTAGPSQSSVCVYLYTSGGTGASSSGKTGAAFDGTAGAEMLDRAPDGPTAVVGDSDGNTSYCLGTGLGGSGYH